MNNVDSTASKIKGNNKLFNCFRPYIYLAPAILFILFVFAYPLIKNIQYSFMRLGSSPKYVGLENYKFILNDEMFWTSIKHNFQLLLSVPFIVGFALLIAALLYRQVKGWKVFRGVMFIPYVLPITVIGVVFSYILRSDGILNYILNNVGLSSLTADWLGNSNISLFSVMGVMIWRECVLGMMIFLARLMSLDEQILEAAKIYGANWLQTWIYVVFPQMASIIKFYVIYNIIILFSWTFNYIFVMTKGGPGTSTYVSELYIYNLAIRYNVMGLASTVSVILFVIVSLILAVQSFIKFGENTV